jgi:hypothetical protein
MILVARCSTIAPDLRRKNRINSLFGNPSRNSLEKLEIDRIGPGE